MFINNLSAGSTLCLLYCICRFGIKLSHDSGFALHIKKCSVVSSSIRQYGHCFMTVAMLYFAAFTSNLSCVYLDINRWWFLLDCLCTFPHANQSTRFAVFVFHLNFSVMCSCKSCVVHALLISCCIFLVIG